MLRRTWLSFDQTTLTMESVFLILLCVTFGQVSATDYGLILARSVGNEDSGNVQSVTSCIRYNSQYQTLPSSVGEATPHPLLDLSRVEGCVAQDYSHPPKPINRVVAVLRGNCTFTHKASMIQAFMGVAALVVDYENSSRTPVPGGNASDYQPINITVATIAWRDYKTILSLHGPIEISMYSLTMPLWDSNMVLIVLVSTALVMIGAGWAAYDELRPRKGSRRKPSDSNEISALDEAESETAEGDAEIGIVGVAIWFFFICGTIVLLYFFYDVMVYFFIAAFCIAGSYSLYKCIIPLWSRIIPITYDIPVNRLPCIKRKVKLRSFLLLMPCLTLGIFWGIERHAQYAWTIQDLLGITFCIYFIHKLRLPNLKVIAVLLILLLIYDVFFVFITPLLTKNGDSIMESVATGGRSHSKESLPMVFLVPIFSTSPALSCRERAFSLLGFGDVIIPGVLVAYNAVFDVKTGTRMVYFACSSLGYLAGMIVCMISLVYMNSGQPALLYLVPGTLFTTVVLALVRKELRKLVLGQHFQKVKDHDAMESQSQSADTEDRDGNNDNIDEEARNLIN